MVDLAKEAFSTNNFGLAVDIYERTIRENGPTSELFLGLADSLARGGNFSKAFQTYRFAYRYGKVTPEKLKHLVAGLIETVKQDSNNVISQTRKKAWLFTCGICFGLLCDPVTIPCGHTFCRSCIERDKSKSCELCGIIHYRLKQRNLNSNVVITNLIDKWFPNECKATRLKKEGNDFFFNKDYSNAIQIYSNAIDISPNDHLLRSNRSQAYASLDQFEEALADAEVVIQILPQWPKGYFRKGFAMYGLGKYEEAALAFLQCLAIDQKVSSAKDYLSKALDKILSALPADDPKAEALQQRSNPTLLQQLVEDNFSSPLLLPDITNTLQDLAKIVKEAVSTVRIPSNELHPLIHLEKVKFYKSSNEDLRDASHPMEEKDFTVNNESRSNSLLGCSSSDNLEIHHLSKPRSHITLAPSPLPRKRLRHPGVQQCPLSPTHSLPQKILKSTSETSVSDQEPRSIAAALPDATVMKVKDKNVEDLECGLCYRLFYEPVTTPCGHTFCRKCLDRCLDHTVTCPMCKGNLADYLAERRQAVTEALQCILQTYFPEEYLERCRINEEEMVELTRQAHLSDLKL
ncbi:LON peptidase N-terminal domain and RING finger protein 3 [Bulinus truncatus]|nr:LON peptidase N-terminal domain and RING finger protein 3 [Bulinus truncatus]